MYYTLEEINLLINDKNYYLNQEVMTVLELLKTDVAVYATINEEIPNKKYEKNTDHKNRYKKMQNNNVDGDLENKWDKQKIFKAIKKEEKTGIDKYIDEIRILLNKISDKNYQVNKKISKMDLNLDDSIPSVESIFEVIQ